MTLTQTKSSLHFCCKLGENIFITATMEEFTNVQIFKYIIKTHAENMLKRSSN